MAAYVDWDKCRLDMTNVIEQAAVYLDELMTSLRAKQNREDEEKANLLQDCSCALRSDMQLPGVTIKQIKKCVGQYDDCAPKQQ
ncbi:hypothetical protein VIS19158_20661 [Vibrio scophthalmi LMG 19158]|uniref:Uncharacterized protein n=2 Tax=Vibrio scophthalmi TaxID=45658 RepID=F9RVX2_9VIBR|nr:hypothetical protein VIS19158_20661 [Vibrio scophthalmi LMG 19158]